MATVSFTTSDPTQERSIETSYDFGDTIAAAVELFGEEAVLTGFISAAKVDLQAMIRRLMRTKVGEGESARDITDEEIIEKVASWKPGVKTRAAADPLGKVKALLGKLSADARADLLAKLAANASDEELEQA